MSSLTPASTSRTAALSGEPTRRPVPPVTVADRVRGPADAPATLVVYGNYGCLHCRRAYALLDELTDDASGGLRVVYRHFARPGDFPNAELAAEAVLAAAAQGRWWDLHLRLATGGAYFDIAALGAHARALGLDVERFMRQLRDGEYRERVRQEHAGGAGAGVVATPSFFLDDEYLVERSDLEAVRTVALERAGLGL